MIANQLHRIINVFVIYDSVKLMDVGRSEHSIS